MTSRDPGASAPATVNPDDETPVELRETLIALAGHLRLLLIAPLLVGLAALGVSYAIPPTYTARTVILPPQQQQSSAAMALQSLGALANVAGAAAGLRSPADQYVALLQSVTVEDRLIDRFELMKVYDETYRSKARGELEKNSRIAAGKKDSLITVEVDDDDPQRAAKMANAYVEELRKLTSSLAITEAQQRRAFFENQLVATKDKLAAAQAALQATGITEGVVRAEPKAAAEAYSRLRAEATAAEVRVQAMRGYLADTAPELRQAQAQLAALRFQLDKLELTDKGSTQGEYISRFREFKYQETLFELFSRQFELAKIDESREGAIIQVVDPATPPDRKSKPKRAVIAAVASLATLGLLIVWILNVRRPGAAGGTGPLAGLGTALREGLFGRRAA